MSGGWPTSELLNEADCLDPVQPGYGTETAPVDAMYQEMDRLC